MGAKRTPSVDSGHGKARICGPHIARKHTLYSRYLSKVSPEGANYYFHSLPAVQLISLRCNCTLVMEYTDNCDVFLSCACGCHSTPLCYYSSLEVKINNKCISLYYFILHYICGLRAVRSYVLNRSI